MREKTYLYRVCEEFFDTRSILEIKELTTGNINETYVVIFPHVKYILQLLNAHVYYSPIGVMNNTRLILKHIRKKVIYQGKDGHRNVLNFIKTRYDQDLAIIDNEYWRCSEYITNAYSIEKVNDLKEFLEIGKAVGAFQKLLNDFEPCVLDDTIRHFHDTPFRFQRFKEVLELDKYNRVKLCLPELVFVFQRSSKFNIITDLIKEGQLPVRVTHNDTKASNVMLDQDTSEYLCLIDLDTVMKGSLVFDYGDALRYGASVVLEDDEDLRKVDLDLSLLETFTYGFLSELKDAITKEEVARLYDGLWIITIELGMRFLHDFLDGDHYFRINKEKHNLIRAKNQLQLVKKIEEKELDIKEIINKIIIDLGYPQDYLISL